MKLQLKRSSVLDSGAAKAPTASQMEYGELAINYNTADVQLFVKDSDDNVVTVNAKYAPLASPSFTGGITVAGDASIADKIIHTGDTNTALRFPSADTFTVETGGVERFQVNNSQTKFTGNANPAANNTYDLGLTGTRWRDLYLSGDIICGDDTTISGSLAVTEDFAVTTDAFFVDSSVKKVGIGTTSPAELLHIHSTATGGAAIEISENSGSLYQSLIQMRGNDLEIRGSSGKVEFYTGNADGASSTHRMVITTGGDLEIGASGSATTTITAAGTATFNGTCGSLNSSDSNYYSQLRQGSVLVKGGENSKFLSCNTAAGTEVAVIANNGAATFASTVQSAGAAMSGAASGVQLAGSSGVIASSSSSQEIWRGFTTGTNSVTSSITAAGAAIFGTTAVGGSGKVTVYGDGSDTLIQTNQNALGATFWVTGGGNIFSPDGKLELGKAYNVAGSGVNLFAEGSIYITQNGAGSGNKLLIIQNAASTEVANINGAGGASFSGNVGIGTTSPSQPLEVKGTVKFTAPDGGSRYLFSSTDADGAQLSLYNDADAQNTRISGDTGYPTFFGTKVGIGTTTPDELLQIYSTSVGGAALEISENSGGTTWSSLFQMRGNDLEIRGSSGKIEFYTGNDDGASSTERMQIDSSGRLAIGNTTAGSFTGNGCDNLVVGSGSGNEGITVYSAAQGALSFADGTSGDAQYRGAVSYNHTADRMDFRVGGTLMAMHMKGGKVLAGTENSREVAGGEARIQVESTNSEGISLTRTSADSGGIWLSLGKTRNGSVCQAGDTIGAISWNPDDGTDLNHASAEILTLVGTGIGSNDVPGDLIFKTNGGTNTTTERMRIKSDGNVGIGTALTDDFGTDHRVVQIHSGLTANSYLSLTNTTTGDQGAAAGLNLIQYGNETYITNRSNGFMSFGTNNAERIRIDSVGRLLVGTTTEGDTNADNLTIYGSNNVGVTIRSADTEACSLFFSDATTGAGEYAGMVQYAHSSDQLRLGSTGSFDFQTSSSGSSLMHIDSSGKVGIGTTTPSSYLGGSDNLVIAAAADAGLTIATGASNTGTINFADGTSGDARYRGRFEYSHSLDALDVLTAATTALRIDSSGRLLVGTTVSRIVEDRVGNGPQGKIQIEATNSDAIMSIISAGTSDANRCGTLSLGRHRNSTVGGTPTIVQDNDALGAIIFSAGDGTDMRTAGASIHAEVDGTPGSNDMPGALILSTTADGAANATERIRIASSGNVGIGTTSPGSTLHIQSASGSTTQTFTAPSGQPNKIQFKLNNGNLDAEIKNESSYLSFSTGTTPTQRMLIASDGFVSIGPYASGTAGSNGVQLRPNGEVLMNKNSGDAITLYNNSATKTFVLGADGDIDIAASDGTSKVKITGTTGYARFTGGHFTSNVTPSSGEGVEIFCPSSGTGQISSYDRTNSDWDTLKIKGQQIEFSCNGSDTVYIGSDGKVGIGTTVPGGIIDVKGSTQPKAYFKHSSSNETSLYIEADDTSARIGSTYHAGGGAFKPLEFLTSGAKRMSIAADGRVGIGTTSNWSASARLEVIGQAATTNDLITSTTINSKTTGTAAAGVGTSLTFLGSMTGQDNVELGHIGFRNTNVSGAYGAFVIKTRPNGTSLERFRIAADGKVGIGVDNPTTALEIKGTTKIIAPDGGSRYYFDASDSQGAQFSLYDSSDAQNTRLSAETDYPTFFGTKVGVGTTSPNYHIDVEGTDAGSTGGIRCLLDSASGFSVLYLKNTNSGSVSTYSLIEGVTPAGGSAFNVANNGSTGIQAPNHSTTYHANANALVLGGGITLANTSMGCLFFANSNGGTGEYVGQINYDHGTDRFEFIVNNNEVMRMKSDGNIGIGTTLSDTYGSTHRVVQIHSSTANCYLAMTNSTTGDQGADNGLNIIQVGTATHFNNRSAGDMVFSTDDYERVRFDTNGLISSIAGGNSTSYKIRNSAASGSTVYFIEAFYSGTTATSGGTVSFRVSTDGACENTNNDYGSISDVKLKQDIVDSSSQWNDIKAVKVRNFKLKADTTKTLLGVVAQEIETVSPGLVKTTPDRDDDGNLTGETTKSVKYSVLYMKAIKALQEAMAKIETLEAKVAALEAA